MLSTEIPHLDDALEGLPQDVCPLQCAEVGPLILLAVKPSQDGLQILQGSGLHWREACNMFEFVMYIFSQRQVTAW